MVEHAAIDESVEGKRVIDAEGEEIGIVSEVRGDVVYVDPDPGITERIMSMLGWDEVDEDDYSLREESIERVTDDEIHLRSDL